MSKRKPRYDNLPKHQKKIVLCLAKEGPMNMSETNKKIKGEYTSTNRAFHELETKSMIREIDVMLYKGRQFPRYWLTVRGSGFALLNDANPEKVRLNALESSKNDEERKGIQAYFRLRETNSKIASVLDRFILLEGRIDPVSLFKQMLPELASMDENEIKEVFGVARKTEYWKHTEKTLKEFMRGLRKALGNKKKTE